eukprot:TRINITY_DN31661_c0_g1_i2.p1 TRINITY_DN31661_c0_g1~~TRINITY_DN31661_c0_g1_i2.p1  ORF type:complete len:122 (-),score=18.91 TRINITY_DN31661_c0_g1_i2:30-395(-)
MHDSKTEHNFCCHYEVNDVQKAKYNRSSRYYVNRKIDDPLEHEICFEVDLPLELQRSCIQLGLTQLLPSTSQQQAAVGLEAVWPAGVYSKQVTEDQSVRSKRNLIDRQEDSSNWVQGRQLT